MNPMDDKINALLDEFEAPPVSLDFNRRLWRRIEAEPAPSWRIAIRKWLAPAIPLATAAALVVAGFIYDHRSHTVPVPGFSVSEADTMERTLDDMQLLGQFEKEAAPKV